MIDLEQTLADALHEYASSVTPSEPAASITADVAGDVFNGYVSTLRADRARSHRRNRGVLIAAALLIAAGGLAVWSARRDRATTVISPVTTALHPLNVGSWKTVTAGPLSARKFPSVLWTGQEFIVWGGQQDNVGLADGAVYNPSTATWRTIRANPRVQAGANAVWTGTHMVVLAGSGGESYDPATDSWASLPSIDPSPSFVGITNAVWTGSQLLGLGVDQLKDPNDTMELRVWTLVQNDSSWSPPVVASVTTGKPTVRGFAYYPNQFTQWNAVSTTDGLVVWDGMSDGWRYTITSGWQRLPTLALPTGASVTSTVTWLSGKLVCVVNASAGGGDHVQISSLEGVGWSPLHSVVDGWIGFPYPISVNEQVVVLGANSTALHGAPLLIDPATERAASMTGYPIDTTIDQGAGWSGTQLLVWGGQTPIPSGAATATASANGQPPKSGSSSLSNHGAIWQP